MPQCLDSADLREVVDRACAAGRDALLETEALCIVEALGIAIPLRLDVKDETEIDPTALQALGSDRVVVKVVSHEILHKSDVGGVVIVENRSDTVAVAIRTMRDRFAGAPVAGYSVNEFIEYDRALGGELLLGLRWTDDFGPVLTFGAGGIYTEFLASNLRTGKDVAILSPTLTPRSSIPEILKEKAVTPLVTGGLRGQKPRIGIAHLEELLSRFLDFAAEYVPEPFTEFEINPLVLTGHGPVALDALAKLDRNRIRPRPAKPRPLAKLSNLLRPERVAVIGVSRKLNPGHIIVNNLLREEFPRERLHVIKPGVDTFEGCPCVPDIASLPEPVDLLIVSVDAGQVPGVVEEVIETRKAESVILIPGGLGERAGTEERVIAMQDRLDEARDTEWAGPILNGGNCLGIRSRPGRYDTLFIPTHKMPAHEGDVAPVAILSQSGAFMVAKASKLERLNPKFLVSIGNQVDLTVGDYLAYLKDDPSITVFACYVEGFKPLDGARFLEAAREITASGRTVLLYRAGRTPEGASATASHTASIAGDYSVTRELAGSAGVVIVDELADFEDLTKLFAWLHNQHVDGLRLGALTNAGFESVAYADNLGPFELTPFSEETTRNIEGMLQRYRLESIVTARNPLDVTPILDDEGYGEAMRAVLEDTNTDVSVIGCVPLSGALKTMRSEGVDKKGSVADRLAKLKRKGGRAFIAVVDGGPAFDRMAEVLEEAEIPTFRTAERALRFFATFCRARQLQE